MNILLILLRRFIIRGAWPLAVTATALIFVVVSCGGSEEASTRGVPGAHAKRRPAKKRGHGARGNRGSKNTSSTAEQEPGEEEGTPLGDIELPEAVFVESDENRDPFRSYLAVFTAQALPEEDFALRVPVLLDDVSLDDMRLIAIVSSEGGSPRAMVVDPDGKGWVVQRGDYLGRGEKIRLGPGLPEREINWRVVRIRPDRIILVREDPVQAGPPVTRVLRLYPDEED